MTAGTKIFLALFALIVAILIVYYGAMMPDGRSPDARLGVNEPREPSPPQQDDHGERSAQSETDTGLNPPGNSGIENRAVLANQPAHEPPPRDPAPLSPQPPNPVPNNGLAGGLLTEGVMEAAGESGGGPASAAFVPGQQAQAQPFSQKDVLPTSSNPQSGMFPLVGLNRGDLQSGADTAAESNSFDADREAEEHRPTALNSSESDDEDTQPIAEEPKPAPAPDGRRVEYVIEQGDTFSSIAGEWLGDSNKWSLIARENPTVDPQRLKIGQRIFLPTKESAVSAVPPPPVARQGERLYIIESGDTLIRIARSELGDQTRWEELYELNRSVIGADPAALKVGATLRLPVR